MKEGGSGSDRVQRQALELLTLDLRGSVTGQLLPVKLTLGTKNVELVALLWARVQLPDR